MDKEISDFFRPKLPSEKALKMVEMTAKGLEWNINLVNKALAGFEKTDSLVKEVQVKFYQTAYTLLANCLWNQESTK